jgi:hypothetical protein
MNNTIYNGQSFSVVEPDSDPPRPEIICLSGSGSEKMQAGSETNAGSGSGPTLIVKIIMCPFLELTLHYKFVNLSHFLLINFVKN